MVKRHESVSWKTELGKSFKLKRRKEFLIISIVWDLLDNIKCTNIGILGIPEREESKRYFFLFEEIIAENFPNLGKEIDIWVQEIKTVPNKMKPKKSTSRHIIILKINLFLLEYNYFIVLWWFLPYININWPCYTCIPPHPETSDLAPNPVSLGCPRAPALGALLYALNSHWSSIIYMIMYMFQCYSFKSTHPHILPLSPKVCSLHLCLLCCLTCKIVSTIFLNSIYMW